MGQGSLVNDPTLYEHDSGKPSMRTKNIGGVVVNEGVLSGIEYDYGSRTEPDTLTDRWTLKSGGSSGTIVAVIDFVYTDTTKLFLSSFTRTT